MIHSDYIRLIFTMYDVWLKSMMCLLICDYHTKQKTPNLLPTLFYCEDSPCLKQLQYSRYFPASS